MHDACPGSGWYVPGGHSIPDGIPPGEYSPGGTEVHESMLVAPDSAENVPDGQGVWLALPSESTKNPGSESLHSDWPDSF